MNRGGCCEGGEDADADADDDDSDGDDDDNDVMMGMLRTKFDWEMDDVQRVELMYGSIHQYLGRKCNPMDINLTKLNQICTKLETHGQRQLKLEKC